MSIHLRFPLAKMHLVQNISILEHPLLQRNQYKLRLWESLTDHIPDILSMRQIKGRVDLIQDIEWRWLVQKQSQDERKCQKGSLAS